MNFPEIGEVFRGRYEIIDVVGTGGFSRVYHARQVDLGRSVAIKILKASGGEHKTEEERRKKFESVSRRFEREAKLISKLRDPHTVVMHDYGRTGDGLFFMVLEYVDGLTIGELIDRDGALPATRVVKILRQALSSLHEAHAFGVLHRDIKPGNIMVYEHVGRSDNVKVLDFGIAKSIDEAAKAKEKTNTSELTAEGILVGTPRYMSPEQIRGSSELNAATDIYSLGLVAYEMLMGVKAVPAESSIKIISRHLDTDPIELPATTNVPRALRSTINRMLAKAVDERFASCTEVLQQLDEWHSDRSFDWAVDSYPEIEDFDIDFLDDDEPKKSSLVLIAAVAIVLLTSLAVAGALLTSDARPATGEEIGKAVPDTPAEDSDERVDEKIADNSEAATDEKPEAVVEKPIEEATEEAIVQKELATEKAEAQAELAVKETPTAKTKKRKKKKKIKKSKKPTEVAKKTEKKKVEKLPEPKKPEKENLNLVPLGGN